MPDNRLTITAELLDRVSPAARKMQRAFDDLQRSTSKNLPQAFKKYSDAVTANEKSLAAYGKRSESTRRELRAFQDLIVRTSPAVGQLTQSLGAFTTGTGSAVGAIGAMGTALLVAGRQAADFAAQMRQIRFGSEASGLGILQLKQTQQALGELGLSSEQTSAAMANLKARMDDARANTGKFIDSFSDPSFREYAQTIVQMATDGASTADVLLKVFDQTDQIKKRLGGARGVDVAGRYLEELGLPRELARGSGKEFRERLEFARVHGSTGAEMKEAAEQARLFNEKLFAGGIILNRMGLVFKTEITEGFLYVNDLLDRIDAKYNAWFGGAINSLFGGSTGTSPTAPGGGTFAPFSPPGSGPQGAGPRVYGGSHGGGAAPGGGGGPFAGAPFPRASGGAVGGGGPQGGAPFATQGGSGGGIGGGGPGLGSGVRGDAGDVPGGDTGYTGTGGFNFMGSQRAAAMGMGDVAPFSAAAQQRFATGIPAGEGPVSITANKYAGADMAGFLKDLHDAGAPLSQFAGAYAHKPLQHGYGNALDIESGFGQWGLHGLDSSPALAKWAQAHPKEFAGILELHHMKNLDVNLGSGRSDWGHFEWSPTGRAPSLAQARADFIGGLSGTPAKVSGTGKLEVNVSGAAVGKTARSQGIFKNLNLQRYQQMQPAVGGPAQEPSATPFA